MLWRPHWEKKIASNRRKDALPNRTLELFTCKALFRDPQRQKMACNVILSLNDAKGQKAVRCLSETSWQIHLPHGSSGSFAWCLFFWCFQYFVSCWAVCFGSLICPHRWYAQEAQIRSHSNRIHIRHIRAFLVIIFGSKHWSCFIDWFFCRTETKPYSMSL